MDIPPGKEILRFAEDVCREYREKDYALTLRQLYYQGVARKFWPSGDPSYSALMRVVSAARLEGRFPLWALVDRTRVVYPGESTRCDTKVERALERSVEAVRRLPDQLLHRDPWFGQPTHVSVWFEKEALAGIFEKACDDVHVSWFSARGDPSHPALYDWLRQAADAHGVGNPDGWKDDAGNHHKGMAKRSIVLYFGDLDPTGVRIPRTAEETVRTFARIMGLRFPITFRRVGITLEMAREMDLPPFPAKESAGADYRNYVEEFDTTDAWELDALSPEVLEEEVRRAVLEHFDAPLHDRLQEDMVARKTEMRRKMRSPEWYTAATSEAS